MRTAAVVASGMQVGFVLGVGVFAALHELGGVCASDGVGSLGFLCALVVGGTLAGVGALVGAFVGAFVASRGDD